MLIDNAEFPPYTLWVFGLVWILNWMLFLRHAIASFFDPLMFFASFSIAGGVTVALVLGINDRNTVETALYTILAWYSGLLVIRSVPFWSSGRGWDRIDRWIGSIKLRNPEHHAIVAMIAWGLCVIVFVAKFGIPALYDNPLDSKLMYAEGSGFLRRMLQVGTLFLQVGLVCVFVSRRKLWPIAAFLISAGISSMLVVSRSSLILAIIFIIFMLDVNGEKKAKRLFFILLPVGVIFGIVMIRIAIRTVLPGAGMEIVWAILTTRIIAYGDAIFYLLTIPSVDSAFRYDDFFSLMQVNLSSFLATIRAIRWEDAPSTGGRIYEQVVGIYSGVGPNATPVGEGWLFLRWFGILYVVAAVSGVCALRRAFSQTLVSTNPYVVFLGYTAFLGFTNVLVDGSFWGTTLVTLLLSVVYCFILLGAYMVVEALLRMSHRAKIPFYTTLVEAKR